MKKVNILCVGKIKESYLREGIEEYSRRISRFARLEFTELKDFPPPDEVRRESDELLGRMSRFNILMDIEGVMMSSEQLSRTLDEAYCRFSSVTFVIGGSAGVDERVRRRADIRLSFGKITFPHQLMRLVLCEQIYRAFSITEGLPYHK